MLSANEQHETKAAVDSQEKSSLEGEKMTSNTESSVAVKLQ